MSEGMFSHFEGLYILAWSAVNLSRSNMFYWSKIVVIG